MNTLPKVSIVIPVYNRENIIKETLNSAINQTYSNIEIIVVDNKSTDNTFEIIKGFSRSHPKVKVYQNQISISPVKNWYKCLSYAGGDYVKILWSDDLIANTFIEKTLPFLVNNKDVGFVFSGVEIFNTDTGKRKNSYFIGESGLYSGKKFIESALLSIPFSVPLSPGNSLFRIGDIKKNLLIDIPNNLGIDFSQCAVGNDLLIYLLTAKDYLKFAFVNETLSFFREHKGSISTSLKSDIEILYNVAKAYFVENYINDNKLISKFNAKLLFDLLVYGENSKIEIENIKDFYLHKYKVCIDYLFLVRFLIRKAASIFAR